MSRPGAWYLRSSSGWDQISFEPIDHHRSIKALEFSIEITGKSWYRPGVYRVPAEFDSLVDDYKVVLPSVVIAQEHCTALVKDFEHWLTTYTPFERRLCSFPGQSASIEFGDIAGLSAAVDRPACLLRYHTTRLHIDVCFLLDQSCVRIAKDGLALVLERFA